MPYPNEYSCRLKNPDLFKDPWVRIKRKSKSVGKVYSVIRGTRKTTNKYEDQAYRYPKTTWSAGEAGKHCRGHKGSYEALADTMKVDALVNASKEPSGLIEDEIVSSETEASLLARFASKVVNTPLMITQDKLNVILNVLGNRIGLDVNDNAIKLGAIAVKERPKREEKSYIAVIGVYDTLVHRSRGLSALSGLSTYEQIGKDFKVARDDSAVKKIVLDVDSSGGEGSGAFDLVDDIYNARGIKPIIAVVNDKAYSAAYAIASAADKVYVSRTGGVGSIGVIAVHTDRSKFNEKMGVKFTSIYAGAKKDSLSPHKEISAEATKDVQMKVDEIYEIFTSTVARNRGITQEDVKNTEAGTYLGNEGLKVGLADEILSWDQVMETLLLNDTGGGIMPNKGTGLKEKLDELFKDVSPEAKNEALSQVGYVSEEVIDVLEATAQNLRTELEALKADVEKKVELKPVRKDKEEIEKYRAEVRKEMAKDFEALRKEITDLKKENVDVKEKQLKAEDGRRLGELCSMVKDMGVVGDIDKHAKTIFTLEKMNPELAKDHIAMLRENAEALKAAGVFSELGSNGPGGESGGAFEKLKVKVEELKKAGSSDAEAWAKAARDNPELYKEYRNERKGV